MALGIWRIEGHALMSDACDNIPHHVHPVSSVVFFGIPTSSLDTPQKSCDNGEKAIEDTPLPRPTGARHTLIDAIERSAAEERVVQL